MQLFYVPEVESLSCYLNEVESSHCVKVLRKQKKDTIYVTDGKGMLYTCQVEEANPKKCLFKINHKKKIKKHPYGLHIAIAPTKSAERFEWFVEKATEIGIDEITPIICDNSERKKININRLEKISISAMKQSMRCHLPRISPVISFQEFVKKNSQKSCYIAHCLEGMKDNINRIGSFPSPSTFLIGPEGDFSSFEIEAALENKYKAVSLGENRLRTETAGVVICVLANLKS